MAEGVCRICGTTTHSAERGGTIPVFCSVVCKRQHDKERKRLLREVAYRQGLIADYEVLMASKPNVAKPALKHNRAELVKAEKALAEFRANG